MHRALLFILTCLFFSQSFSQRLAPDKYWIPLADKEQSNYSVLSPQDFLSASAIARRNRQGISVTLQDLPVSRVYLDSLREIGLKILGTSKWFNSAIVQADNIDMVNEAKRFSFVLPFDHESPFRITGDLKSLETMAGSISGEETHYTMNDYGFAYKQLSILNGKSLHELGYKGYGMKIAVLDAGFYRVDSLYAFSSLWQNDRILGYRDFVNIDENIFEQSSHGMSVLSTMAANIPGIMIGTAPESSYWLLRTEDTSSEYKIEEANWVMAAEYADSAGADIINCSLGYSRFDDQGMNYTYEDMNGLRGLSSRAADIAFAKGMIVVVSAGNEGNKDWEKITAPSDAINALAIGAIDTFLNMAPFSSMGPSFDGRVKPDLIAVGYRTAVVNTAGGVNFGFGTSYAAPQVAGMIACLWQAFPQKKNTEIVKAIINTADSNKAPGNDRGYGIPDFTSAYIKLKGEQTGVTRVFISPNPFNEYFEVSFDIRIDEITITDMSGRKLFVKPVNLEPYEKDIITPSGLAPGVYLISGRSSNQRRISRLIVK